MLGTVLFVIGCIVLVFAIGFLINAGVVWLIVWALKAIGVTTICGWTVAFSWPLVLLFTVVCCLISGFFAAARGR